MPTIIRQEGFRIVIYPNDHMPAHVHVIKGDGEVRIKLGREELLMPPSLITVMGKISDKDVAKALFLVTENHSQLLTKWREFHNES
ncbi:MAG: DUF4160 domain-containing protein [Pleurocapsa sp. SU_5_0]|nr:DUF4160 domain-containing protein [Pleurocapsa sp. SU_5_0]NJO98222.1 DUF4160 domain-containing protein [Pleurocapsa sp. CRU_1_2]